MQTELHNPDKVLTDKTELKHLKDKDKFNPSDVVIRKQPCIKYDRAKAKETTLLAEVKALSSKTNEAIVLPIRDLYLNNKPAYYKAKELKVPCYFPSIDFEGNQTNIGCLDIDRKKNTKLDFAKTKKLFSSFSWVMVCAYSLSGDGLFILFRYGAGKNHKQAIAAGGAELLLLGIEFDDLHNLDRIRAQSYDPAPYINWDAELFDFEEVEEGKKKISSSNDEYDLSSLSLEPAKAFNACTDFERISEVINEVLENERGATIGNARSSKEAHTYSFTGHTPPSIVVLHNEAIPFFSVKTPNLDWIDEGTYNPYDFYRIAKGYPDTKEGHATAQEELSLLGFGVFNKPNEAQPMKQNRKEGYSFGLDFVEGKKPSLNQLTGVIELDGVPLNDIQISSMLAEASLISGKNQQKDILLACLDVAAYGNSYHPIYLFIKELQKLEPTDLSDIDELDGLIDCFTSDTPKGLIRIYIIRWMLGLFDLHLLHRMTKNVLVLAGEQNACKTAFSKNILPESLKQYGKVVDFNPNKMTDSKIALCSLIVACFDEFEEILTKHRTLADFKNLTASYDIFERRPYRRNHEQMFRSSIVMTTTNQSNFLNDSTGNTRFLTINVKAFDLEKYHKIDLMKVWRVIYDLHLLGETSVLNDKERALQTEQNQNFEAVDPYCEMLEKVFQFSENGFLTSTEIMQQLERETRQNLSISRIGQALKKLGFERVAKKISSSTKRGYKLKYLFDD